MEIIENTTSYDDTGVRVSHKRNPQGVIPRTTRADVENSAFTQTFRDLFTKNYNPVAMLRRHHELQKSR